MNSSLFLLLSLIDRCFSRDRKRFSSFPVRQSNGSEKISYDRARKWRMRRFSQSLNAIVFRGTRDYFGLQLDAREN